MPEKVFLCSCVSMCVSVLNATILAYQPTMQTTMQYKSIKSRSPFKKLCYFSSKSRREIRVGNHQGWTWASGVFLASQKPWPYLKDSTECTTMIHCREQLHVWIYSNKKYSDEGLKEVPVSCMHVTAKRSFLCQSMLSFFIFLYFLKVESHFLPLCVKQKCLAHHKGERGKGIKKLNEITQDECYCCCCGCGKMTGSLASFIPPSATSQRSFQWGLISPNRNWASGFLSSFHHLSIAPSIPVHQPISPSVTSNSPFCFSSIPSSVYPFACFFLQCIHPSTVKSLHALMTQSALGFPLSVSLQRQNPLKTPLLTDGTRHTFALLIYPSTALQQLC